MEYHGDVEIHEGGSKYGVRLIGGSVTSCNIIGFAAGTTGYCGGDSGHGGRTFFSISDRLSSDIRFTTSRDGLELSVEIGGDSELDTIIQALKSIALILEAGASGGTECTSAEQIMALMKGDSETPLELRKVKALEGIEESLRFMSFRSKHD